MLAFKETLRHPGSTNQNFKDSCLASLSAAGGREAAAVN